MRQPITLVLPHYMNLGMLAEQQRVWASYAPDVLEQLHGIVVDDCSPDGASPTPEHVTVDGLASFRIFRLLEKKRWNWPACRNLGAKMATTEWMILTDIDHVVPPTTMLALMGMKLDAQSVYQFQRMTATKTWPYDRTDCEDYKIHNDSFLLTRGLFFDHRVGGYDERLSGCYGSSGEFRARVLAASRIHQKDKERLLKGEAARYRDLPPIIRYPREVIADASTHPSVYTRKGDPDNDAELKRRKDERAKELGWKPLNGLVPHTEVYSSGVEACC